MKTIYNRYMKQLLKNGLRLSVIASIVFSVTSCDLDEEGYNFYPLDDYFENTSRLEMAVNAAYIGLCNQTTYGQYWMVYDTDTDLSHIKGSDIGHVARDLGHYNIYSTHSWLQDTWATYYTGIDRVNLILENMDKVQITDEKDTIFFKNLVGQSRALRAIYYFDLVKLFGDVPLRTKSADKYDEVRVPKTDRAIVYDTIIADLKSAIIDLPWRDEMTQTGERISKGAAMGMLAKVYLFRGGYSLYGAGSSGTLKRPDNYKEYYQEAKKVLDELITANKHGLLKSYERVFRNMCELEYDPFENMFEVSFFSLTGQVGTSSTVGTYNGPEINAASSYGRANSFIKTQNFFYDTFDPNGDLRRDVAIATFSINKDDVVKEINRKQSYNWAPGKWRRNWHTGKIKDNNNTDLNAVILRYADVLLMRAEVENELNGGPNDLAIEALNQVRRRAFGKDYLTADAAFDLRISDFGDKESFFNYLFEERARELCFEGHRRMDLIRWGLLNKTLTDTKKKFDDAIANKEMNSYTFTAAIRFKTGVHELYPIPDYDVRETGGTIIQNPGY
ncbi:RagB/SusD family nutrient uptake outer membrane protein [Dysgonomonas sp. 520]|uniref:RagB/SusD family nutrient uptake outer membrane protein n=1 Tax=Dysgonomonas sp. 520 TaxID=2302931 RepID=UPI0013CFCF84|nr:RagB/SusD family nutrient uptake outer membrane protein [Dysgonomonas sp. 520]NDW09633.1 RagB/SusD family nutrient uptake outer membrane protein [Dysgonomonas sp. 520]